MSVLSGIFGGKIGPIIFVDDGDGYLYNQIPGSELVLIADSYAPQADLQVIRISDLPQPVQDGLGCTLIDLEDMYE